MRKLTLLALLASSFTFASGNMKEHDHKMHKEMTVKLKENKSFNTALEKYEAVAQAFFDNEVENIKKTSKDLITAINAIDNEEIKKTLKFSKKKLEEISKSDNLEKNQEAFSTVSQAFHVVLTKYAENGKYARYYCPMVKKYWLQNTKKSGDKTYNIYAAKSMPHCGGMK